MYRPEVLHHIRQSFGELSFAIDHPDNGEIQIDILIGLDTYWRFIKADIVRGTGGLVAQDSVFDWVLSGSLLGTESNMAVSVQLLCFNKVTDTAIYCTNFGIWSQLVSLIQQWKHQMWLRCSSNKCAMLMDDMRWGFHGGQV